MPTISLRSPLDGAVYLLGAEVLADYACADEPRLGPPQREGSVAVGGRADTTAVGEQSFTVEAVDLAGNLGGRHEPLPGGLRLRLPRRGPRAAGRQRAARRPDAAGEVLARRLSRPPRDRRRLSAGRRGRVRRWSTRPSRASPPGCSAVALPPRAGSLPLPLEDRAQPSAEAAGKLIKLADGTIQRADFRLGSRTTAETRRTRRTTEP